MVEHPPEDQFVRTAIRGMRPPEHHPEFWDALSRRLDDAEDRHGLTGVFGPPGSLDAVERATPRERPRRQPAAHAPRRAPLRATTPPPLDPRVVAKSAELPVPVPEVAAGPPLVAERAPEPEAPAAPPKHAAKSTRQVHIDAPTASVPAAAAAPAPAAAPKEQRVRAFVPAQAAATTAAALAGKGVRAVDPMAGLTVRHDEATLPGAMRRTSNIVLLAVAAVLLAVAAFAGLQLVQRNADSSAPPPATAEETTTGDVAG